MTSLFFPDMLQTDKHLYFLVLWPITVEFDIWGHILLLIGHIASKREKTSHGSNNDNIINLKAIIERYTFSSILYVPVAPKLGILGSFMLLMTNNYKFVSKK